MSQYAVKRLTASDLTFFKWHYHNHPAGNQKAINLNKDVFIDDLFPSVPDVASPLDGRLPLDLYLLGPGLHGPLNLQRKIISSHKNWRLDGEFVHNPPETPERFNSLAPGDIALFGFDGDLFPTSARMFLLAASVSDDAEPHRVIDGFLGSASMLSARHRELEQLVEGVSLPADHPLREILLERDLEDASVGGTIGLRRLWDLRRTRPTSRGELRRYRKKTGELGEAGEMFVNLLLGAQMEAEEICDFRWVSEENASAPYDFLVTRFDGQKPTKVDVKSTSGDFDNPLHISLAELVEMALGDESYDIYRVYELADGVGNLRVARGLRGFAEGILECLGRLPQGVEADSISVLPEVLDFGDEQEFDID